MPEIKDALWVDRRSNWPWTVSIAVLVSGGLLAASLGFMRQQTVLAGVNLNNSLARLVAEQTTRTLQTVDERLELTQTTMELMASQGRMNASLMRQMYQDQLKDMPSVDAIWFQTAMGNLRYTSRGESATNISNVPGVPASDYAALFKTQPQSTFFISDPIRHDRTDRTDDQQEWEIHMARPVYDASGQLAGVLVASVNPRNINKTWDSVDYGESGSIALLNYKGTMLMRSPFMAGVIGKNYKHRPVFQVHLPDSPFGNYEDYSSVDGVKRMYSYRTLEDYPDLVVVVGQSLQELLGTWWQWTKLLAALWLLVTALVIGVNVYVMNMRRHRSNITKDLLETEDRYRALFLGSVDAILLTSPDGTILQANPAACQMFDMTETDIRTLGRAGLVDATDPQLPKAIEERTKTGSFRGELMFIRKGGARFIGEVYAAIFQSTEGKQLSTMIIRDVTGRKNTEKELLANAEKMQALSRSVIVAQETERRRIAAELHDELGQSLTAIKINLLTGLDQAPDKRHDGHLESIRIVDETLQQVRRLALALRPSILDNLGLVPALNAMGKQTAGRVGFDFRFFPITLETRLVSELETTCFRIVQECLTNIVRHAHAKHVSITMILDDKNLVICVEDDGVGFDWQVAHSQAIFGGSFGVVGMRERAHLVGGELLVESRVGEGCTVTLTCPLQILTEII